MIMLLLTVMVMDGSDNVIVNSNGNCNSHNGTGNNNSTCDTNGSVIL